MYDDYAVRLIKSFEGYRPKAYGDYKQQSIGYGTTANSAGEVIDRAEAERRLNAEMQSKFNAISGIKGFDKLNTGQQNVLTSFAYNVGPGAVTKTKIADYIAEGQLDKVDDHMMQYINAGGKPLDALKRRRGAEADLWNQSLGETPTTTAAPKSISDLINANPVESSAGREIDGLMSKPLPSNPISEWLAANQVKDNPDGSTPMAIPYTSEDQSQLDALIKALAGGSSQLQDAISAGDAGSKAILGMMKTKKPGLTVRASPVQEQSMQGLTQ